jgi:hypothetical protein
MVPLAATAHPLRATILVGGRRTVEDGNDEAALLGAVAIVTGGELLLAAVVLGVVAFAGLSYWRARDSDPGLTTETALVLTTLLGGLAMREPAVAAGLGVVVAALLTPVVQPPYHSVGEIQETGPPCRARFAAEKEINNGVPNLR